MILLLLVITIHNYYWEVITMTNEMIKQLLDACFLAKKITETMPKLPKGLKPRHIHIITSIAERSKTSTVRVSDVSNDLKVTMPSVTKLINELESMDIIQKIPMSDDRRATSLALTPLGINYHKLYVVQYHSLLINEFKNLDIQQCTATIATIEQLYDGIKNVAKENCYANDN